MTRLSRALAELPTTNARIAWTLAAATLTALRVVAGDWTPPEGWLWFLAGMAGIDTVQYAAKRVTFDPHKAAAAKAGETTIGAPLEAVVGAGAREATD